MANTSEYTVTFYMLNVKCLLFCQTTRSGAHNSRNCQEKCLFSGIRVQARQCLSFSKGIRDWQGHDLLYLQIFCDSLEGLRPGELPGAVLLSHPVSLH